MLSSRVRHLRSFCCAGRWISHGNGVSSVNELNRENRQFEKGIAMSHTQGGYQCKIHKQTHRSTEFQAVPGFRVKRLKARA